ncbi:kinase-like domain-containing protein, partial [Tribonema minus]
KWRLGPRIGAGSFGVVHQGLDQVTGQLIAVSSHFNGQRQVLQEVAMMKRLRHRNIVCYLGAELHGSQLFIHEQFIAGGSLEAVLRTFGAITVSVVRRYTLQILEGISYLHSCGVVHRDLKAANVLIDTCGTPRISDFGTSCINLDQSSTSMAGTPQFMAPEVLQRLDCGMPVDIWGFGCTLIQMITGHSPWHGLKLRTLPALLAALNRAEGRMPPLPPGLDPALHVLLVSCFQWEPAQRPTSQQLLLSNFFSDAQAGACGGGNGDIESPCASRQPRPPPVSRWFGTP